MNPLKKLAGQTAIYGLSSIVGRLLNYLLVPFHTNIFKDTAQYGIVNEMYAYVAFLIVILTYGMETAFFKFSQDRKDKQNVYTTILLSLLTTSSVFIVMASIFAQPIAAALRYPNNSEYVIWFAIIIAFDAITSIPFAKLRSENKAKRFALIKTVNIAVNIGFNFFFLLLCPYLKSNDILTPLVDLIYRGNIGIGYIFIANLLASVTTLLMLLPEMKLKLTFDKQLYRQMFKYAFPLLIFGLAGIVNEVLDRILLKYLLPKNIAMAQLGIYGACYKISIMITIFIQAFRYAAEPFFFSHAAESNARKIYADVMKYFVIILSLMFLCIMLYMDVVQYFVGKEYRSGLTVVPILLLANFFLGIYYNLSIWYKLTGHTRYGAYISIVGAIITIGLNVMLIPLYNNAVLGGYIGGYMGSAWATFLCYFTMMVVSYVLGQRYYRIEYQTSRILFYIGFAVLLYFGSLYNPFSSLLPKLGLNTVLIALYLSIVLRIEGHSAMSLLKRLRNMRVKA